MESMEARTGDSTSEATLAPKDRRVPLAVVVFVQPTAIPGSAINMINVTTGESRAHGGHTFVCPQPFFDPLHQTIAIAGREYPLSRVHYMERARMATSKLVPGYVQDHTIGPRKTK